MVEILYEDREPGDAPHLSRILILGDKLRLDAGDDRAEFILYDRSARTVYQVSALAERITEIPAPARKVDLPPDWRLELQRNVRAGNPSLRLLLDGRECVEVRSAPILVKELALMVDFRRGLAGLQAESWAGMPEAMRDPCSLVLDSVSAGIEYDAGLPLAIRYADGRGRSYRSHALREARPKLFQLSENLPRFRLGPD